jgi:hypothetical protein
MVERQVHGTIPLVSIVDADKPLCSSTAKLLKLHEIVVRMFASAETFRLSSDVDRIRQPTSVAYMFSSSREASILEMPCRIPASGSIRDVRRQHPERLELTLRRPFPRPDEGPRWVESCRRGSRFTIWCSPSPDSPLRRRRAAAYADRLGEWLREDAARLVEEATWRVQDHNAFPRGIVLS